MEKYCVDCSIRIKLFLNALNEEQAETIAEAVLDNTLYDNLEYDDIEYETDGKKVVAYPVNGYPKEPKEGTALAILLDKIRNQKQAPK